MSQMRNHVGMVVDRFWKIIPAEHYAFKVNPSAMPIPHQHFMLLGQEVIRVCKEQGFCFEDRLQKDVDVDAWKRLLGAWIIFTRQWSGSTEEVPSRLCLAQEIGIDASSLTNFLNARRPITLKGLKVLSKFLGVKILDLRPEMGASDVYSQDRKLKKNLLSISSNLDSILIDMQRLTQERHLAELSPVIERLRALRESVCA